MRNRILLVILSFLILITIPVFAQKKAKPKQNAAASKQAAHRNLKTENVILITLDGYRWQELYTGADPELVGDRNFVKNRDELKSLFWDNDPLVRRTKLMPFVWSTMVNHGQLAGNHQYNNKVNVRNKFRSSYPGYNELLTGFPDDRIMNNDKKENPNKTVLEYINQQRGFTGKVAAFGSWELFPYILRAKTSGIPVNAGFATAQGNRLSDSEKMLNQLQSYIPGPWGHVRLDAFTHYYAMEYLKKNHLRVIYIAYGETDDHAHDGNYEAYLKSANRTDALLKELWTWVQETPRYRNKTTLIITTDHGRGIGNNWKNHGLFVNYSDETWFMVIGPDTQPLGELKNPAQFYTDQLAKTLATFLNVPYKNDRSVGDAITAVIEESKEGIVGSTVLK